MANKRIQGAIKHPGALRQEDTRKKARGSCEEAAQVDILYRWCL